LSGVIGELFNWRVGAKEACQAFWSRRQPVVSLPQAVHTVITAPTGLGKNVSCILPFLRRCPESCVVPDFKGENCKLTADFRRHHFGNTIVKMDPYRIVTPTPDTFNPLDCIEKESPLAIDECNDLAGALVVRSDEERDPHWNNGSESHISGITAVVVAYGEREKGTRSLQTVNEILGHPQKLEMGIKLMLESDHWGGLLAQKGGQLMQFVDKERSSVLTTTLMHLRFLATPAIVESTSSSSFDPAELREGRMTIYLILPPDRARAQSGLLRMWIGSLLRACVRGGLE
jgi:type IV secretion system protein VirD4